MKMTLLLSTILLSNTLYAATFVVDTTSDASLQACTAAANDCSLRGALATADAAAGADMVAFNIPMSDAGCVAATGVCRITLVNGQLNLNTTVTVDGYTQPGAIANSNSAEQGAMNGSLRIELVPGPNGSNGFQTNNVNFTFTLRGLALARFVTAVSVAGNSNAVFNIEGNYFGTDAAGAALNPRQGTSIGLGGTGINRIGGTQPDQRNLISNSNVGIGLGCCGHLVQGNLIGTNLAGTQPIANNVGISSGINNSVGGSQPGSRNVISGNLIAGIIHAFGGMSVRGNFIGTDAGNTFAIPNGVGVQLGPRDTAVFDVVIGGTAAGEGNVIAFNSSHGVQFDDQPQGNRIFGNSMRRNAGLGISFARVIRTPNDVNDADAGTNKSQNFADISAFAVVGSNVNLSYRVDSSTTNSAYPLRVELYKADGDEGRDLIGVDSYLAIEAQSVKTLSLPIPNGLGVTGEDTIVATATDAQGNTSEFSFSPLSFTIETPVPSACSRSGERVFCDGFDLPPLPSIEVTVRALSTVFRPNGNVRLSDDRGASCTLTLAPISTPLTSAASCVLGGSGAPGPITITAVYDTFSGAFGSATGGNITVTQNFTL